MIHSVVAFSTKAPLHLISRYLISRSGHSNPKESRRDHLSARRFPTIRGTFIADAR